MNFFVVFCFGLLAVTQGRVVQVPDFGGRIVNGVNAELGDRPFQVSLQFTFGHFCGGSIVNEYWVVSAAHCLTRNDPKAIRVVTGTVNLKNPYQVHRGEKIIVHEDYMPILSHKNDISLLKVSYPFIFSDVIQPVPLPEPHFKVNTNDSATVSGWGGLKNGLSETQDRLQMVDIYIADQKYCRKIMKEEGMIIFETNVCANDPTMRKGQCTGDSGGPLTVGGKLIGIVSWSIKDPDCASTKYPGVYTRASEYVDWILENTKEAESL